MLQEHGNLKYDLVRRSLRHSGRTKLNFHEMRAQIAHLTGDKWTCRQGCVPRNIHDFRHEIRWYDTTISKVERLVNFRGSSNTKGCRDKQVCTYHPHVSDRPRA